MKYLTILLALMACNNANLPAGTSTKAGEATEGSAQTESTAERSTQAGQTATTTSADSITPAQYTDGKLVKVVKSEEEWKRELNEQAFNVLRKEGTERAFTGKYWNNHDHGVYVCAGCSLPLFASDTKFESGTGWPSFYQPISADCIADKTDSSYGMDRTEVECARCGGHQGHVFPDGPKPTGLRYCINSVSLKFVKQ